MEGFASGWIGGIAGTTIGHPFDVIKGRIQTQGVSGRNVLYNGPFHCFVDICKTEGTRALFKGLVPPMLAYGLMNGIVFGTYSHTMSIINPEGGRSNILAITIASTVTSLIQTPIASSSELIKLRLQIQGIRETYHAHMPLTKSNKVKRLKGPLEISMDIYRSDGVKGFCRGMGTCVSRDIIGLVSYFMTYEILCQKLAADKMLSDLTVIELMISGGVAGVATWTSCYPLDVVKSRIQTDGIGCPREYKGTIDCFIKSYRSEGLRVFYRGLGVTVVRAFPVNAVTFYTVTSLLNIFNGGDSNREHSVL